MSNKLLDFATTAIYHYDKNLKSLGGKLELILLKRQKRFKDPEEQKKYDTNLLAKWLEKEFVKKAFNIILDPEGKALSTDQLTDIVRQFSKINFIIGGDIGVAKPHKLLDMAHLKISVSPWVISHQVCIVMCAEQAWRILSIIKGHPYHK